MPEDNKRTLNRVKDVYVALLRRWQDKRTKTERTFGFVKGDSWEKAITDELDKQGLPWLVLNIMLPIMMRIFGAERQSRGKLKAVPMKDANIQIANIFTRLFDWIESIGHTTEEFGKGFKHTIIGDIMGWVRVRWTTDIDPLGAPIVENINPFFVLLGECEKQDLSDCKEIIVTFFKTKEELIELFPDKADDLNEQLKQGRKDLLMRLQDFVASTFGVAKHAQLDFIDERTGQYRVIELYERQTKDEFFSEDLEKITPKQADILRAEGQKVRTRKRGIITITTTVGDLVLLQEATPLDIQNNQFPLFPIWGLNIDGDNIGLGRQLEGPQEEYQKARSAELHIIGTMANSGWTYEDGALDPAEEKKLEDKGGMTGLILKYNQGHQKPDKILPNQVPTGMLQRAIEARNDMQFISSVSENTLGRKETSSESGVLFQGRVEEFLSTLQEFFSNLRKAQERAGNYLIDMIQTKMKAERVIQIVSEDGSVESLTINERLPFTDFVNNDISQGRYIAKAEVAPTTQTARREVVNLLLQSLQYSPPEISPAIVKAIFKKLESIDEETRQDIIQELDRLIPPTPQEQLQAELNLEAGQGVAPVETQPVI
jgi:hypothetical protein